jgi:hypothetical protein
MALGAVCLRIAEVKAGSGFRKKPLLFGEK